MANKKRKKNKEPLISEETKPSASKKNRTVIVWKFDYGIGWDDEGYLIRVKPKWSKCYKKYSTVKAAEEAVKAAVASDVSWDNLFTERSDGPRKHHKGSRRPFYWVGDTPPKDLC